MISYPSVAKRSIRGHYDLTTPFYRLYWGPHIHHGLWDSNETPRHAQLRLIEQLAARAGIRGEENVIDVGCGMGGSSITLARRYRCRVTGITISPVQRYWAGLSSLVCGVGGRTRFQCVDAEIAEFPPESFDVLWSVECTEHLFDKPGFFARAAPWLKRGGRVAICAWLAGDAPLDSAQTRLAEEVCEGFLCPSLGTAADYEAWMRAADLEIQSIEDWTARVTKTWEICHDRVERSKARWIAPLGGPETSLFVQRFKTMLQAYRSGAMKYGCFVARRPG